MNIFIVAMPGCGNLGDDLISKILIENVFNKFQPNCVGVICGNNKIDHLYHPYLEKMIFLQHPTKSNLKLFFERKNAIKEFVKSADLVIIGGGGLFQDTHSPFTIHKYLKYLAHSKAKVMIAGVGVGPVKHKFNQLYLRYVLNKIENIQVRDEDSRNLLVQYGVKSEIIVDNDIVEGSGDFFAKLKRSKKSLNDIVLGCSIRNWDDVDVYQLEKLICKISVLKRITKIIFFVFENGINNSTEHVFAINIINQLKTSCSIEVQLLVYNKIDFDDYMSQLFSVDYAIASRFHANVIWQYAEIPTIPIVYSPKVKSLYDKYDFKVYNFNELVLNENVEKLFIKLPYSHLKYKLPEFSAVNFKRTIFLKTIQLVFNFSSFIYETLRSIYNRLK